MKIKCLFLASFLIAATQLCIAQEDKSPQTAERFVFTPAPSAAPLVVLKSDKRTMELDPRNNEVFDLERIDSQWVKSISVLKDENARELYGERGANGVVIVELVDNYIFSRAIFKKIKEDN